MQEGLDTRVVINLICRLLLVENSSPTMSDLYNWLHPLKEVSSNDSSKSISALVGVVKELTPLLSVHRPGKANSPIITSLRVLLTYVIPPDYGVGKGKAHLSLIVPKTFFFFFFFFGGGGGGGGVCDTFCNAHVPA